MTKKSYDIKSIIACQRINGKLFMSSATVDSNHAGDAPLTVESACAPSSELPVCTDSLLLAYDDDVQYADFPMTYPVYLRFKLSERLPQDARVLVVLFGQSVSVGMYASDELVHQAEFPDDAKIPESIHNVCGNFGFVPTFVIVAGVMADKDSTYRQIKSSFPDAMLLRDYHPEYSLTAGMLLMAYDLHKHTSGLMARKDKFIDKMRDGGFSMAIQLAFNRMIGKILAQTVKGIADKYVKGKISTDDGQYPTSVLVKAFKTELKSFVDEFEKCRIIIVLEMVKTLNHWLDVQGDKFSDLDPNWKSSIPNLSAQLDGVKFEDFANPWDAACIQDITTQAYGMCGMPGNVNKNRDDADVRAVVAHIINKKSETVSYSLPSATIADIIDRLVSAVDEALTSLIEARVSKSPISQLIIK